MPRFIPEASVAARSRHSASFVTARFACSKPNVGVGLHQRGLSLREADRISEQAGGELSKGASCSKRVDRKAGFGMPPALNATGEQNSCLFGKLRPLAPEFEGCRPFNDF